MGYETGEWVQDPKPPVTVFNGTPDEIMAELDELWGDAWLDMMCMAPGELSEGQAKSLVKLATSVVTIPNTQCRHCGNWDGVIQFYNDEGTLVHEFEFTD